MPTRSTIVYETDAAYSLIHSTYDGYPEYTAPILLSKFNTPERVGELVSMGNLFKLAPEIGEQHKILMNADTGVYYSEHPNWCSFLRRDYGQTSTEAGPRTIRRDMLALGRYINRWLYLYDAASKTWTYCDNESFPSLRKLSAWKQHLEQD